nr:MAG TPA: hypothetical protein [Caudoviricetes sp.]
MGISPGQPGREGDNMQLAERSCFGNEAIAQTAAAKMYLEDKP